MKITRTAIKNTITGYMSGYGGQGSSYDCHLNSKHLRYNSYKTLKDTAELGDEIEVAIYRGGYYIRKVYFTLTEKLIEEYGKREKNKWGVARDSQRSKLYRWQNRVSYDLYYVKLTEAEIHDWMDEICSWYGIQQPTWAINKRRKTSCYWPHNHHIDFAPDQLNPRTLIHEVAHAITRDVWPAHCPIFVGTYITMLHRWGKICLEKMLTEAERLRLKFDSEVPFFPVT